MSTRDEPLSPQAISRAMRTRLDAIIPVLPDTVPTSDYVLPSPAYQQLIALQRDYDALLAAAAPPQEVTIQLTGSALETKALVAVTELGVADALGDEVLDIEELAQRVDADPRKLGQVMRMLSKRSVFDQVGGTSSDKYACNRVSRTLSSKSPESLVAYVGHWGNDTYDAAQHLTENLRVENKDKAAFQLGHGGKSFFEWLHESGQELQAARVNASQLAFNRFVVQGIVEDFSWDELHDIRLIDVGGGVGPLEMEMAPLFPNLSFEVQDLESVVVDGRSRWLADAALAPHVESGRVRFAAQDFFQPQPQRTDAPEAFLIKQCLHNWADDDAIKILSRLKEASGGTRKLYAIEFVLGPESGRVAHMIDINIQALVNSIQRTEEGFRNLLGKAGWKLERVVQTRSCIAVMSASPT